MSYTISFWGTRGSIPAPGPETTRFGGNTPCVAVDSGGEGLVILDAGTGIRRLGQELAARGNGSVQAEILISHTHWDHIQGLPFFAPLFIPGNIVKICGAPQGKVPLEQILRSQMEPVVFPVPLDALAAKLSVRQITASPFTIDGFRVESFELRHPGTALAYRLTPRRGGPSMVYVTDNELGPGGSYGEPTNWRQQFVEFLRGASLLIHDAMFTPDQIQEFAGWGHSSYHEAVEVALEAGVEQLVLFHHRPEHSDAEIDAILRDAKALVSSADTLEIVAAQEGLDITL